MYCLTVPPRISISYAENMCMIYFCNVNYSLCAYTITNCRLITYFLHKKCLSTVGLFRFSVQKFFKAQSYLNSFISTCYLYRDPVPVKCVVLLNSVEPNFQLCLLRIFVEGGGIRFWQNYSYEPSLISVNGYEPRFIVLSSLSQITPWNPYKGGLEDLLE